jgi:sensor histidine kinase YesM
MPILDPNYKKTEFKVIAFIVNNSLVYFKYFIYGLALFYANRAFKRETELRMEQEETFRLKILQLELERENQKKEDDNLKLQQEKLHLENQQLLLQHQNLQYQYAYLRAQMNPHNLQNLLNMLIAKLVRAGSADMINPMVILSKIMRYSMDVKTDEYGRVPLGPEIEHVHNILKMNEYRQKTTNAVDFKLQGHEAEKASIVPLIIIPFIENAIKYAVLDDESDPLQIHIKVQNNQLLFFTRNKIKSSKAVLEEGSTSHGIGLSNTRQRLNATYGEDGYSLQMQKEGDYFSVTLTIFDLQIKPKIMLDDVLAGGEMMA